MTDLLSQLQNATEGSYKGLRYEIGKQIVAESAARYEAIADLMRQASILAASY